MKIVTRFAPSPTGNLHIGSARTALFNWLFAKNTKGKFLLRIEDTDKVRSTKESINKILDGLTWLNLQWDDRIIYQSKNQKRHKEVAEELLKKGLAYKCFCSEEDLDKMREEAKILKKPFRYNRMWREKNPKDAPQNIKPVIRIKSPIQGETVIDDIIQGTIKVSNEEIDDFIILRSDGRPTYMLSVVVDDYDMMVTHLIRGHDHLTNTFRQNVVYEAMKWKLPEFAHIPLIHSTSGKKLSKRDNASTLVDYIKIGILPEALRNYLLRLGWSYKDKEIFTLEESIQLFNLSGIGKSPSKLDMDLILSINEHYIKNIDEKKLFEMLKVYSEKYKKKIDDKYEKNLINSIHFLKNKAKKLEDIYENARYVLNDNIQISPEDLKLLDNPSKSILNDFLNEYEKVSKKNKDCLEKIIKGLIDKHKTNFKGIGQPLRIALTGSKFGPAIYDILLSLDKNEVVKRLKIIK